MLRDVALDELQQHVGHVLPLGSGNRLEAVVELDWDVQVRPSYPLFFLFIVGSTVLFVACRLPRSSASDLCALRATARNTPIAPWIKF